MSLSVQYWMHKPTETEDDYQVAVAVPGQSHESSHLNLYLGIHAEVLTVFCEHAPGKGPQLTMVCQGQYIMQRKLHQNVSIYDIVVVIIVAVRDVPVFRSCTVIGLPSITNFMSSGTVKVLKSPVDILATRVFPSTYVTTPESWRVVDVEVPLICSVVVVWAETVTTRRARTVTPGENPLRILRMVVLIIFFLLSVELPGLAQRPNGSPLPSS